MIRLVAPVFRLGYFLAKPFLRFFLPQTRRAKVLVKSGDKLLLVRNLVGTQEWTMPGGGIKPPETPLQAAQREVSEEVGLKLEQVSDLGVVTYRDDGVEFVTHCFQAAANRVEPRVKGWEIIEAKWFSQNQLPQRKSRILKVVLSNY